jgi:hypothetical protein
MSPRADAPPECAILVGEWSDPLKVDRRSHPV